MMKKKMKMGGAAPKKAMMGNTMMANPMMEKPMMKMGGSLKSVDKGKNPGLAKLPTPVRNKMGYKKYGGDVDMMQDGGPVFKGDPKSDKKILRKVKKFIKSPVAKNPAFEAELAKRKPKMQAGGVVKTQPKRMGPIDPNGPYTIVQERTLRGDKVAAPKLVKDKELGATKMKKGGKVSKKK